jgi:hypothetical protein
MLFSGQTECKDIAGIPIFANVPEWDASIVFDMSYRIHNPCNCILWKCLNRSPIKLEAEPKEMRADVLARKMYVTIKQ